MMPMTKKEISDYAVQLFHEMGGSVLKDDPLFENFKEPGVIGPWHMSPAEGR